MKKILLLLVLCPAILQSCNAKYGFGRYSDNTEQKIPPRILAEQDTVLETKTGVASYYAEKFHGRKTASGEIFDMNALTAAHPSYPFGTIARITNLKNGKTVIVKINDRFPSKTRLIDLSKGAARKLDMILDGIANVRLEVLEWGE